MSKTKIIIYIIILTALFIGGYFFLWPYYKDWQAERQNKKFLFGSVSTQLPIESKQEKASGGTPQESNSLPQPTKKPGSSEPAQLSQKAVAPENPIETISSPQPPTDSEIQEQISKPEIPSEITEKKFSPVAPLQSTPEPPIILAASKNTENEEEPEESVSTSTSAILPQVSIYLSGYSITARGFTVIWQSSSTDIATYDVDRKINFGDWQNWLASTTATSTIFEVPQDKTVYYFRARAANLAGLTGDWQEISVPIYFYPVVINEIAWAGTGTSTPSDEWIELFNKTDQTIDLSGWAIFEKNATTTILKNNIASRSYYLIERTDDTTVSDITADLAKSFGGSGLSNSGENLRLVDASGQIIDIVDCSGGWLAGSAAPDYKSMERVNPYLAFDVPGNWQSNSISIRNGLNVDGQPINGTPKAQNSVFDLEFFYLYPLKNTTATSTDLKWTPSYIDNFNEYKVIRSFDAGFNPASTTIVTATTTTSFFDESLESQTAYYYKISACDLSDYCVFSNIASTTTSKFPFSWVEPQLIFETATSSATSSEPLILDVVFDAFFQPEIIWIFSSTLPNATSSDNEINVFDNQNQPYVFWIEKSGGQSVVYFKYQKTNGWTPDKQIFDLPYEIDIFAVVIDPSNTAYLAFIVENDDSSFILSQVYYASGAVE